MLLKRKIVKELNRYKSGDFDYIEQSRMVDKGMKKSDALDYLDWRLYVRKTRKPKTIISRFFYIQFYWWIRLKLNKTYFENRKIRMKKSLNDCIKDGYIDEIDRGYFIKTYKRSIMYINVNNEGRMFIKWYVFVGRVLRAMDIKQLYILLLTIGALIGLIPFILKLLNII